MDLLKYYYSSKDSMILFFYEAKNRIEDLHGEPLINSGIIVNHDKMNLNVEEDSS